MTKKMTVVFHDEELNTDLKIEAVRRGKPASEIIAEAVKRWLNTKEEEGLLEGVDSILAENEETGGYSLEEVSKEIKDNIAKREKAPIAADRKNVRS